VEIASAALAAADVALALYGTWSSIEVTLMTEAPPARRSWGKERPGELDACAEVDGHHLIERPRSGCRSGQASAHRWHVHPLFIPPWRRLA
jgi:hypothetical protein